MNVRLTDSATRLVDTIEKLTVNSAEVLARIMNLLEGEEPLVTSQYVSQVMRNVGKPAGEEVKVGSPTEPMNRGGYPVN